MDDVVLAEQALVAGLVLEPDGLDEVTGWLSASDFRSPACGLLFARLAEVRAAGSDAHAEGLLALLRARGELRRDGYPLAQLVSWFDTTPAAGHPAVYGRLVVDAAVARQVEAAGTRLVQLGAGGGAARALTGAAVQRALLSAATHRLDALPGPARPAAAVLVDVRRVPSVPPNDPELAHAELVTVGALLVASHLSRRVVGWLRPEDFADAGCGVAFARTLEMRRTGVPVDRVTLGAELRRHGELGVVPADLPARAEAAVPVAMSVGFYARRVLSASVHRQVGDTGARLIAIGRERRGDGRALLSAAVGELDTLRPAGVRLRVSRCTVRRDQVPTAAMVSERLARPVPTVDAGRG